MPKKNPDIGRIIRSARRASNLSQIQLAERVGISYQQIQKYENGASELTLTRLHQVAKALGIPATAFILEGDHVAEQACTYGKIGSDEEALLNFYRKIRNEKTKEAVIALIKSLVEQKK